MYFRRDKKIYFKILLALIIFNDNKIINDNNKAKCSNNDGTNNNNDIYNSINCKKL